ncbi:hypothetical protein HDU93_000881 [Gonapodya sp. JEL0774]|nr:hypothetical protein HDU93_000881 [Gonapodya sp. JEL0774]
MSDRATPYFQSAFVFLLAAIECVFGRHALDRGDALGRVQDDRKGCLESSSHTGRSGTQVAANHLTALQSHLCTYLIELTVLGSVFLKRSPLPDLASVAAERGLETYNGVEKRYAVRERTVDLTQLIVKWALWVGSVAATAGVKVRMEAWHLPLDEDVAYSVDRDGEGSFVSMTKEYLFVFQKRNTIILRDSLSKDPPPKQPRNSLLVPGFDASRNIQEVNEDAISVDLMRYLMDLRSAFEGDEKNPDGSVADIRAFMEHHVFCDPNDNQEYTVSVQRKEKILSPYHHLKVHHRDGNWAHKGKLVGTNESGEFGGGGGVEGLHKISGMCIVTSVPVFQTETAAGKCP